jgi:hypothetical protein
MDVIKMLGELRQERVKSKRPSWLWSVWHADKGSGVVVRQPG